MKITGMNYQDWSWSEVSRGVAHALAGSLLELGVANFHPENAMVQRDLLWELADVRIHRNQKLPQVSNTHGRKGIDLALTLLDALMGDQGITYEEANNQKCRARIPGLVRLANMMPTTQKVSYGKLQEICSDVLSEVRDRLDVQGYQEAFGQEEWEAPASMPAMVRLTRMISGNRKIGYVRLQKTCGEVLSELRERVGLQGYQEWEAQASMPALVRLGKMTSTTEKINAVMLQKLCDAVLTELRERVGVQGYQKLFGLEESEAQATKLKGAQATESMSGYRLYQLRLIDTCMNEMTRFFDSWSNHVEKMSVVLNHEVYTGVEPFEVQRLRKGHCKAAWLLRWSEHYARKDKKGKGPLHGSKVSEKRFPTKNQSLEARIDDLIGELAQLANEADIKNGKGYQIPGGNGRGSLDDDLNDPEFLIRIIEEAQYRPEALLLNQPDEEPEDSEKSDELATAETDEDGDEDQSDSAGKEEVSAGEDDVSEVPGPGDTGRGDEDDSEDISQEILLMRCLDRYPLATQVGVVLAKCPQNSSEGRAILKHMKVFDLWKIPATTVLSNQLLAAQHPDKLTPLAFAGHVKGVQLRVHDCLRNLLFDRRDKRQGD